MFVTLYMSMGLKKPTKTLYIQTHCSQKVKNALLKYEYYITGNTIGNLVIYC